MFGKYQKLPDICIIQTYKIPYCDGEDQKAHFVFVNRRDLTETSSLTQRLFEKYDSSEN